MNYDSNYLDILPVKIPEQIQSKPLSKPIHPILPQMDKNVILVYAPKASGKGVWLNSLIFKFWGMDNIDSLFYISPTIKTDKTAYWFREKYPNTLYTEYSDELINDIIRFQKNTPSKERGRAVIIADDCVDFSQNRNALTYLCTRARHVGCLPIILSQSIRSVNKIIRNQASEVVAFKLNSDEEINSLYETYGAIFTDKKTFRQICRYVWDKKYNFMYMRLDENPVEIYKNFTEKLNDRFKLGYYNNNDNQEVDNNNIDDTEFKEEF